MEPRNESRDLPHIEAPSTPETATDADVARLIQNVGAPSIHSARIGDHALPGRGQHRLTIWTGAKLPGAVPVCRGSYLRSGYLGKRRSPEGKSERPTRNSDTTRGLSCLETRPVDTSIPGGVS